MFKLKQGKRLIISFLCLLLVALATFSYVGIIEFNKKNNNMHAADEIARYVFTKETLTRDDYEKYNVFVIDSDEGLLSFHNSSFQFGAKMILLENDVFYDFENGILKDVLNKDAVFDGQGHTITFLGTHQVGYQDNTNAYNYYDGSFCTTNKGTIRNVRIQGVNAYVDYVDLEGTGHSTTMTSYYGCIAGTNEGTIESCLISDTFIKSNRFRSNLNVAAVVAKNNSGAIVKNCLVEGYYKIAGNDGNGLLNQDGMYAYRFVAYKESDYNAQKCLFDTTVTPVGDYTAECKTPGGVSGDNFDTTLSDKTAARLSLISQVAWHVPPTDEYNDGWPYLEVFIDFDTYNYTSAENGTVTLSNSDTKVNVPTDVEVLTPTVDNFNIYGVTITATPNTGYKFKNWTASSDGKTYTAHFELLPISVTFNPIHITRDGKDICFRAMKDYADGNKNVNEAYSPGTILIGQNIQILYNKSNNLLGFINMYEGWNAQYWMYRTEGNPDINIWKKYTLVDLQINGQSINSLIGTNATLEQISTITGISIGTLAQNGITVDVIFEPKTYGVTFG